MKELAGRIVALGVGQAHPKGGVYYLSGPHSVSADKFTHSWEVAGALMEKCREKGFEICLESTAKLVAVCTVYNPPQEENIIGRATSDSAPHAINLACVEALEE